MNIINGIVGALIGGSLVWVLGRAYGEGVGAAKSLFVVGKKAGNEDIKLYIDHKIARDGFITKMIFMQGLNDQLDDCIEAIDSMNHVLPRPVQAGTRLDGGRDGRQVHP